MPEKKIPNVKFMPFTQELHHTIIRSKYTHIKNIGYLPIDGYFGPLSNNLDGFGLYIQRYDNIEKYATETINATITTPGAQYNINAPILCEMYYNISTIKFYVYLDLTNYNYRKLLKKLEPVNNPNKLFNSPIGSP